MMTGSILTNVGIDISEVLRTCIGQRLVVAAPVAALNAIPIQSFCHTQYKCPELWHL
jgi:hypothetical protein